MSTRDRLIAHVRKGTSYRSRGQPAGGMVARVLISMRGRGAYDGLTHQSSSCPFIGVVVPKPDLNRKLT